MVKTGDNDAATFKESDSHTNVKDCLAKTTTKAPANTEVKQRYLF